MRLRRTYHPLAQRFFDQAVANGAVAGTTLWKASVNTLVLNMVAYGLWPTPSTGFDAVYLWCAPDTVTGRINLVFPTLKNGTLSGSGTFVAYRSLTGNAVDCTVSCGSNTLFTRYVQNSGHASAWALSGTAPAYSWGFDASGRLLLNHGSGGVFRINTGTSTADTGVAAPGLYAADRLDSATSNSFFNGAAKSVAAASTSAAKQNSIVLLQSNAVFSNTELAVAGIGSQFTPTQEANWYTSLLTFMRANSLVS